MKRFSINKYCNDGPFTSDFSNKSKKSYQIEAGVCPNINPGQGMSDPVGALRICHESSRGTPHVELLSGSISK